MRSSDALVPTGALVRAGPDVTTPLKEAEQRLRALLDELSTLDLEVESLTAELTSFSARYEQELGTAFSQLERRERLVRRLQALQDEVERLAHLLRHPEEAKQKKAKKGKRSRRESASTAEARDGEGEDERWTPGASLDDESDPEPLAESVDLESEELTLKRLYRKLARLLHPDLARDDAERARLHALMSQVNVAYEQGDRTTLELILARVDRGELLADEVSPEERLAHLEKRIAALTEVRRSLLRDRERLRSTSTFRLFDEWKKREADGRDYFQETLTELGEDAERAMRDAFTRMGRLDRAARELTALKHSLTESRQGRALRTFDPILESPLVRRGVAQLERRRATAAARELAQALEDAAESAPWEGALVLLAFFAEVSGRPPDALASAEGWAERYAAIASGWPEAPSFEELLTRLPAPLELGLRGQQGKVRFGVQLRHSELLAGVPIALERKKVAELARRVLSHVGPGESCKQCGEDVFLVHLMRTRGLDELNGLACPSCGHVAKSYFLFNWSEGHEALLPFALQTGLVDEVVLKLAGKGIAFQLVPARREALTAGELKALFAALYLQPYGIEADAGDLVLKAGSRPVKDEAPVPATPLVVSLRRTAKKAEGALTAGEKGLLAELRSRIERRFRPG